MDDQNKDAYGEHYKETPESRALHYAHWHAEAYGCAAPLEEVVAQVMVRHGMRSRDANNLLIDMESRGTIQIIDKSGSPRVVPNAELTGPRVGHRRTE